MAEVDPKLCIALDDINEAMDCESQGNMGVVSYRPSSSAIMRTWRHLAGPPEKDGMPRFRLKKPAHWSVTWS